MLLRRAPSGPLLDDLARDHTVLAPDLLGHGGSDKPRGDYSVAAYANGVRDLLGVLDIERVTLVGHSLGGGVAMQFAYQYPERTERIVLIGAGGVSQSVSLALRTASLPGAQLVLGMLGLPGMRGHFPFHTHPREVLRALRTFLTDTAPAHRSAAEWRDLLRRGRDSSPRATRAGDGSGWRA